MALVQPLRSSGHPPWKSSTTSSPPPSPRSPRPFSSATTTLPFWVRRLPGCDASSPASTTNSYKACAVVVAFLLLLQMTSMSYFFYDGQVVGGKAFNFVSVGASAGDDGDGDGPPQGEGFGNWFDGCRMVYLDCGTNRGVQIRKLFEPELYPDAEVLPIFDRSFGPASQRKTRKDLCAVGFEPNPTHTENLQRLQESYNAQGWRVKIFTNTAVDYVDGSATLNRQSPTGYDPGASIDPNGGSQPEEWATTVVTMDLAKYIMDNVAPRRIGPDGGEAGNATVVMKMDIEGREHAVFPQLFTTGAVCQVDILFAEMHYWGRPKVFEDLDIDPWKWMGTLDYMTTHSHGCRTVFSGLDDESYDISDFPLPGEEGKEEKKTERRLTRTLIIRNEKLSPSAFSSSSSST